MSFNFSDNEEEDFDLDAYDDTGLLALASRDKTAVSNDNDIKPAAAVAVATPSPATDSRVGTNDNNMAAEESFGEEEEGDGGDWDNVNWEDADDEGEDSDDDTPQNFPTQGVMINFGKSNTAGKSNTPDEKNQEEDKKMSADETDSSKSKKRKRKIVRVLRNVPYETQQKILNVRRSGMLCEVVQSMQYSYLCGSGSGSELEDDNGMLLSTLAYSMIPQEFHNQKDDTTAGDQYQPTIPTKQQLHNFSKWYFNFVNQAGERRRAALERNVAQGAVAASTSTTRQRGRRQSRGNKKQAAKEGGTNDDTSSQTQNDKPTPINLLQTLMYLSFQYDEDPQLFVEEEDGVDAITAVENISSQEKVLLFLTMVRSLGWRARYVTALKPLSLELTVDHPLLASFPVSGKKSSLGKNKTRQLQKLLGLLHDKKQAAAPTETIDLMSSDDEEDTKPKAKEMTTATKKSPSATITTTPSVNVNSLSWVEVLCCDDSSEKKQSKTMKKSDQPVAMWIPIHPEQESIDKPEEVESILAWMNMKSNSSQQQEDGGEKKKRKGKWGKVPSHTKRSANTFPKKLPVSYVLAVEHSLSKGNSFSTQLKGLRLTDVTPRYANTWSRTLRLRGATGKDLTKRGGKCVDEWWESSLKQMNRHCRSKQQGKKSPSKSSAVKSVTKTKTSSGKDVDLVELDSSDDEKTTQAKPGYDSDEHEDREAKELTGGIEKKEKIPTSKKGFKQSPFYVIPSVLNSQDVLHPDARKRICGVFKGEMVYKRSDVSKALRADKWLYQGRKVKESEMDKPAKKIKARKKSVAKGFNALSSYGVSEEAQEEMIASIDKNNKKKSAGDDQKMHNLYGIFQTEKWKPPHVGPNDSIPTNEFRNVELALINPGLTHMDRKGLAPIAKKLGIPYAPCMLGYEGSHAVVRGIVVHSHNVELMQMASVECQSHAVEKERENKRKEIIKKWKRLVVGLLTKERLDREYG